MNSINVIPILLEDENDNKINLEKNYPVFCKSDAEFFKASIMFFTNGVSQGNYNIYAMLSNYDKNRDVSTLLLGGFSLEEEKFYNNSSRFNFTSPIFSDMNNLFNLDIYGIKQDIDPNARELNDGFFKAFTNKDFDVQFIMNRGIKISHLTFNVSKEVL